MADWQDEMYAVLDELHRLEENRSSRDKHTVRIAAIICAGRKTLGEHGRGTYLFGEHARTANKVFEGRVVDMCMHNDMAHAATRDVILRWEGGKFVDIKPKSGWLSSDTTLMKEDGSQVLMEPVRIGPIEPIASYSGTLHLLSHDGLTLLDGAMFVTQPVDWGSMPSQKHGDLLSLGSRLLVATDRGLAVLRGRGAHNDCRHGRPALRRYNVFRARL